jgi:hypothetical protein
MAYVFGILAVHAWFWIRYMPMASAVHPYYYLLLVQTLIKRKRSSILDGGESKITNLMP